MMRLVAYEYKKIIMKKSLLVLILVFSLINILNITKVYNDNAFFLTDMKSTEDLYWELYSRFSGEITDDKITQLLDIYTPLKKETADQTASTRTDYPNTMTGNVYMDKNFINQMYVNPMQYFATYKQKANTIALESSKNMEFYLEKNNQYDYLKSRAITKRFMHRDIQHFEYIEMYEYYIQYDISVFLILLLCLYVTARVFVIEKESEMDAIIVTTVKGGRKTYWAKIIATLSFVVAISIYFFILDFISFEILFQHLGNGFMPAYSLKRFMYTPLRMSLFDYSLLSMITKIIGVMFATTLFMGVSCWFKNGLVPFVLNLVLAGSLIVVANRYIGSNIIVLKAFNPFMLLFNRGLYMKTEFVNVLGNPVLIHVVSIAVTFAMTVFLLALIGRVYPINQLAFKGGKK